MMIWLGLDRKAAGDLLVSWARKMRRKEDERQRQENAASTSASTSKTAPKPPSPDRREGDDV